jgi:polysaccharide pyruvyl transferase WcaK-like protein
VNVVLDISGYAYGDDWGPRNAEISASYYSDVKRRGANAVLFPQQLGPFERQDVRDAFRRMVEQCDIVFARDEKSYSEAHKVLQDNSRLRIGPDFTVLQQGNRSHGYNVKGHACIVPNYRMLEATDAEVATEYPRFLQRCIKYLSANAVPSVVVVHEDDERDAKLAAEVARTAGIDVIKESDPLRLKGLIGDCHLMVGSRFHGLVSALSQNVPAIGTGWSHKYRMLFKDYDQDDALLSVHACEAEIAASLSSRMEPVANEKERARLRIHSERQKSRAVAMWSEVEELLDGR